MLVQGTLDESNNVIIPTKPTVWIDTGGGGSGSESDTVKIDPTQNTIKVDGTVPVSGPLTNAQLTAVSGAASVAAWPGTGNGTLIAILKALYAQNEEIKTLLNDIKTNTAGTP